MKCNQCAEYGSAFCGDCLAEAKTNNALAMAKAMDKLKKVIPPVQKEDAPGNSIAAGGVDMAPTMGPKKKKIIGGVELTNMTDRRRSAKKLPVLLKRFRKYMEDVRVNEAVDLEKKIRAHHDKLNALEADAHDAQYGRARSNKAATTKVRQTLGKHITAHYGRELDHQEKANVYTALQNKKALPKL